MKIDFIQMHTTPGLNFNRVLNHKVLSLFVDEINVLSLDIPHLVKKYNGSEYSIHIYINAVPEDVFNLKGPIYLRKRNVVEFFSTIPYKEMEDFKNLLEYVLSKIKLSIFEILEKYKVNNDLINANLNKCFSNIFVEISENKQKYMINA